MLTISIPRRTDMEVAPSDGLPKWDAHTDASPLRKLGSAQVTRGAGASFPVKRPGAVNPPLRSSPDISGAMLVSVFARFPTPGRTKLAYPNLLPRDHITERWSFTEAKSSMNSRAIFSVSEANIAYSRSTHRLMLFVSSGISS